MQFGAGGLLRHWHFAPDCAVSDEVGVGNEHYLHIMPKLIRIKSVKFR